MKLGTTMQSANPFYPVVFDRSHLIIIPICLSLKNWMMLMEQTDTTHIYIEAFWKSAYFFIFNLQPGNLLRPNEIFIFQ